MTFLELEKECKRRKKKFYIIIGVVVIFLLMGLYGFYYYFNAFKTQKKLSNKKSIALKKENNISKKIQKVIIQIHKDVEDKKILKEKKDILIPVLDFNLNISPHQKPPKTEKNITKINTFIIENSLLPSFDECLKRANFYLNRKKYKSALKWAKLANQQNKKDKRPWIITAKALYNLGNKEKAIEILEIYFKFAKDKNIKELLNDFKDKK